MSLLLFSLALLFFAFCGIFSAARSAYLQPLVASQKNAARSSQASQSVKEKISLYIHVP